MLTENAELTLRERYYLRDAEGRVIEDAAQLWDRIAAAVAGVESPEKQNYWFDVFRGLLDSQDFLPNTPTIMNAGVERGQLSACFVLPIEDSIEGIFETLKQTAKIHQSGGGTGFDFSRLRPTDSMVSSKQGVASGPISFASVYNQSTEIMKQGGKRKGANMMNLRVDHPNILDFIDMKMTPGVMENFNVSVTVTDAFMEALKNDAEYDLTHPTTGVVGKLRAKTVWDKIANNAWRSAEPGIIFIDRVNDRSSYWERIEATNPCGEQPLPPYGSCNLGSINLSRFALPITSSVSPDGIDWPRLADVTRYAVRFLDNVIDANHYPTPELEAHAQRYRNIGLGVMGWADLLLKLRVSYNSEEAVDLGRKVMAFINRAAHEYSVELANEKGIPEAAPFKTHFDYSNANRRNATLTTVAPTGSLCILADCSSGVEPNFGWSYEKHVLDRVLTVSHPIWEQARQEGWYTKELFVEAHEIDSVTHVDMQAAFQENCDSAISKTINLPNSASVEDVQAAYWRAWETDCKGVTVYRDGSRQGVLHKLETEEDDSFEIECNCEDPALVNIIQESGCEKCTSCGWSACLIA